MQEAKLYLVFEFLTMDLKKYMDTNVSKDGQMDPKLTKSYTYQVTFNNIQSLICLRITLLLLVLDSARYPILSPKESPSQRHETPESSDRQERLHQDRRLRAGSGLRDPSQSVHPRGGHPVVQSTRGQYYSDI